MIVTDPAVIRKALDRYPFKTLELDVEDWMATPGNYALDIDGDVGMFEAFSPGVVSGHYFFESRGKDAIRMANRMLSVAYQDAEIVRGLTPVYHKAAACMARILGFKSIGEVDTSDGPCIIFMMTKADFMKRFET